MTIEPLHQLIDRHGRVVGVGVKRVIIHTARILKLTTRPVPTDPNQLTLDMEHAA